MGLSSMDLEIQTRRGIAGAVRYFHSGIWESAVFSWIVPHHISCPPRRKLDIGECP